MGDKITIDSATLMNKAFRGYRIPLAVLSALGRHRRGGAPPEHDTFHGRVRRRVGEGAVRAAEYALCPYSTPCFTPGVLPTTRYPVWTLARRGRWTSSRWSRNASPALTWQSPPARRAEPCPPALSAADEVAVQAFLAGSIRYTDIYRLVERVLVEHVSQPSPDLDAIVEADRWANLRAAEIVSSGMN